MKKLLLAVFAVAMLFVSCGGKSADGEKTSAASKKETVKKINYADSYFIYSGWTLYEQRSDEKMYAVQETEAGNQVKLYLTDANEIEQKTATRHLSNGTEEEMNFVHINYDGNEFWTRDIFICGKDSVKYGIVLTDTFLYSDADIVAITKTKLSEGDVVTVLPDSADSDFYHVKVYNGTPFGKEAYVKNSDVETDGLTCELIKTVSKLTKSTKPEVAEQITEIMLENWSVGLKSSKVTEAGDKYFFKNIKKAPVSEELLIKISNRELNY